MRQPLEVRLWARVQRGEPSACWEWQGARNWQGYGQIKQDGKNRKTHRLAYRLAVSDIPAGMIVCHRCDNPPCCNPAHLFVGTHRDNSDDKVRKGRHFVPSNGPATKRARTQCHVGHEYTAANTAIDTKGRRRCRACARATFHRLKATRPPAPPRVHVPKTHCPKGHAYTDDNVKLLRGVKCCRTCARESTNRSAARRRANVTDYRIHPHPAVTA